MKRTLGIIAAIAIGAAAPTPSRPSAFDFQYEPTPAGRESYVQAITAAFAPMVTLAPICHLRSQAWANTLDLYLTTLLNGPIKGSGETTPTQADVRFRLDAWKAMKGEAAKDFTQDAMGTCKDVRTDSDLPDADQAVKAIKTPADSNNPWAGAGGKP